MKRLRGVVIMLAATLVAGSCGTTSEAPAPASRGASGQAREVAAQRVLARATAALRRGDVATLGKLGIGTGRDQLRQMAQNVSRLGLSDIGLRFVAAREEGVDQTERSRFGPPAWIGRIEVAYRFADWEVSTTRVAVEVAFVPATAGAQAIAGLGGEGRTPLWLSGPLDITTNSAARTVVIAPPGKGQRYARLVGQAVKRVRDVLLEWSGPLVVEVPASTATLDAALGAAPADDGRSPYAAIAAVTATTDGSERVEAPVHVFVNPEVFGRLGERGAAVVLAHEATHVATGAARSAMPPWLLEGFADYVAFADGSVSLRTAAQRALMRVRRIGPPSHLPTAAEMAPTAPGLAATYEQAWLAAWFIAARYGRSALVDLYDAVERGDEVPQAFERILGTTEADFVESWAAGVAALAGSARGRA